MFSLVKDVSESFTLLSHNTFNDSNYGRGIRCGAKFNVEACEEARLVIKSCNPETVNLNSGDVTPTLRTAAGRATLTYNVPASLATTCRLTRRGKSLAFGSSCCLCEVFPVLWHFKQEQKVMFPKPM